MIEIVDDEEAIVPLTPPADAWVISFTLPESYVGYSFTFSDAGGKVVKTSFSYRGDGISGTAEAGQFIDGVFEAKKYENFCSALCNMKEIYKYDPPYDTVILTGLVGLFEVCFEQSWKMMKEILESHGYEEGATGSPKIILKTAYKAGMIKDEELWLRALQERNNVAHSYNERIALGIVMQAKESFYDMFCQLKNEIDKNWL